MELNAIFYMGTLDSGLFCTTNTFRSNDRRTNALGIDAYERIDVMGQYTAQTCGGDGSIQVVYKQWNIYIPICDMERELGI